MTADAPFTIEVQSLYEGFWRYNVALTCGCFDAEGRRTGFASASSQLAAVGSNLASPPAGAAERRIELRTEPCARFVCFLYVIPHTLPALRAGVYPPPIRIMNRPRRAARPRRPTRG